MAIDWTDYRRLSRADKASRLNQFDREIESVARQAVKDDIFKQSAVEMTAWVLMLRALELPAAEIAEAILLCEVQFPYADFDGNGPYGNGSETADEHGNEIIDRAMHMASQWRDDGYPECFAMHDTGYTKFGPLDRLREVAQAARCPESFTDELVAGAVAAKAACDVLNFMVMTEGYADSATQDTAPVSV